MLITYRYNYGTTMINAQLEEKKEWSKYLSSIFEKQVSLNELAIAQLKKHKPATIYLDGEKIVLTPTKTITNDAYIIENGNQKEYSISSEKVKASKESEGEKIVPTPTKTNDAHIIENDNQKEYSISSEGEKKESDSNNNSNTPPHNKTKTHMDQYLPSQGTANKSESNLTESNLTYKELEDAIEIHNWQQYISIMLFNGQPVVLDKATINSLAEHKPVTVYINNELIVLNPTSDTDNSYECTHYLNGYAENPSAEISQAEISNFNHLNPNDAKFLDIEGNKIMLVGDEKYMLNEYLGNGANGVVLDGYKIGSGKPSDQITKDEEAKDLVFKFTTQKDNVSTEMSIYNEINKTNHHYAQTILHVAGEFEKHGINQNMAVAIQEKVAGMSLSKFKNTSEYKELNKNQKEKLAKNIHQAVEDIIKKGYYHGDLTLDNIFIDPKTLKVELIDFGGAHKVNDDKLSNCGVSYFDPAPNAKPNQYQSYTHPEIWEVAEKNSDDGSIGAKTIYKPEFEYYSLYQVLAQLKLQDTLTGDRIATTVGMKFIKSIDKNLAELKKFPGVLEMLATAIINVGKQLKEAGDKRLIEEFKGFPGTLEIITTTIDSITKSGDERLEKKLAELNELAAELNELAMVPKMDESVVRKPIKPS